MALNTNKTGVLSSSPNTDINVFKTPNLRKRISKKINVLDEDSYLNEMGKIIERDFFPDLEKLRAQNDYLEALERNDMQRVRELYAKYSSGRLPLQNDYASPATFETPIDSRPADEDTRPNDQNKDFNEKEIEDVVKSNSSLSVKEKNLSLDEYLGCHTSEDNQSFQEIIKESEIQHKHKHSWLYEAEENCAIKDKNLVVPSIEEQASGKERPFNLDSWNYRSKNYIMYVPDGVGLSDSEKIQQANNKQEINHSNTRLAKCPFDETQNKETIQGLAINQSRILEGKIGVDGKELTFGDTPKVNGFSFVNTPSPAPGVNESPLMTWGNIDGTPFRLDGGDTPLRASTGPSFKIPEPPKREKLALALAEKAGERHRDRKKKALLAAQRQFASPSPSRTSGCSLDRLHSMSPAAQRLASSKLKRLGSDSSLLASYSPLRRTPLPATPSPSPKSQQSFKSPAITSRQLVNKTPTLTPKRTQCQNITDNLLNLPKRPRAADYFDM
ncbi:DiGeorge syndrome critical region protein 14 [Homalodisca vitripennis]|nr:DiGeorge syndrome critical region protein 14 [Homalodisca vitripennis]